jgi:hypothetical protein
MFCSKIVPDITVLEAGGQVASWTRGANSLVESHAATKLRCDRALHVARDPQTAESSEKGTTSHVKTESYYSFTVPYIYLTLSAHSCP